MADLLSVRRAASSSSGTVSTDYAFMLGLAPRLVAALPAWRDRQAALAHYATLFRQVLEDADDTAVLIATRGGQPAGFTVLYLLAHEHAVFVKDLAVSEQAEGSGVARLLMEVVYSYAREHGCRELRLKTDWNNGRARAFYERAGFRNESVTLVHTLD